MSDAREGHRSVRASLSQCRRARALAPAPWEGRRARARWHGGKASRRTILRRPLPGPATGNMEHGKSMYAYRTIPVQYEPLRWRHARPLSTRLGSRHGEQTPPPILTREASDAVESHVLTIQSDSGSGGTGTVRSDPGRVICRIGEGLGQLGGGEPLGEKVRRVVLIGDVEWPDETSFDALLEDDVPAERRARSSGDAAACE